MLVNKSGAMLIIGRMKIRTGECVPGINLTAGEKKAIESFTRAGYLVEEKPAASASAKAAEVKSEDKAEVKSEAKAATKAEAKAADKQ